MVSSGHKVSCGSKIAVFVILIETAFSLKVNLLTRLFVDVEDVSKLQITRR